MNNSPEIDSMRYLLGEQDREEQMAFERRTDADSSLAKVLRETRETLTGFALESTLAEPLGPSIQRENLAGIMAVVDAEPRVSTATKFLRRWAWPLAASILLAFNVWQYSRPDEVDGHGPGESIPALMERDPSILAETGAVRNSGNSEGFGIDEDGAFLGPETGSEVAGGGAVEEDIVHIDRKELQRLHTIHSDHQRLIYEYERLRTEQVEVLEQIASRLLAEPGLNRLATMELVDSESYSTGQRKGLLDFALNLLTEPGIVALDRGMETAVVSVGGQAVSVVDTVSVVPGTDESTELTRVPYAWSVFDETEARGFLNLYNLPVPAAGESLQLWVRPAADSAYLRVGEVPEEYHGGSGILTYTLPGSSMPPAEILITAEPVEALPEQPVGLPVLRGP